MENLLKQEAEWKHWHISSDLAELFNSSPAVILPETRDDLIDMSVNGKGNLTFSVAYDVEGKGNIVEADVVRCKNGIAINYPDPYMRRRDPNCMVVNNIEMTDKVTFEERFKKEFAPVRKQTFDWLAKNELILVPFMAGGSKYGYPAMAACPE